MPKLGKLKRMARGSSAGAVLIQDSPRSEAVPARRYSGTAGGESGEGGLAGKAAGMERGPGDVTESPVATSPVPTLLDANGDGAAAASSTSGNRSPRGWTIPGSAARRLGAARGRRGGWSPGVETMTLDRATMSGAVVGAADGPISPTSRARGRAGSVDSARRRVSSAALCIGRRGPRGDGG